VRPASSSFPEGEPGAGGTTLLLQKWRHDSHAWERFTVDEQVRVVGRTKPDFPA
jgi:putative iron-dependent peroxidase